MNDNVGSIALIIFFISYVLFMTISGIYNGWMMVTLFNLFIIGFFSFLIVVHSS